MTQEQISRAQIMDAQHVNIVAVKLFVLWILTK
jgi:hypothetical protein